MTLKQLKALVKEGKDDTAPTASNVIRVPRAATCSTPRGSAAGPGKTRADRPCLKNER